DSGEAGRRTQRDRLPEQSGGQALRAGTGFRVAGNARDRVGRWRTDQRISAPPRAGAAPATAPAVRAGHRAGRPRAAGPGGSALQQLELVGLAFPLLGIRRRRFLLGDDRPLLRQLGIELLVVLLSGWQLFLGKDGLDRALGLAQRAVDA